eukprot:Plantae.Rhodophyta-Palmaria_palmata.ctg25903.p1 GENE.Plantae.Rhodophyta-Palmaria_palmata.ctg25903~~Plantae.Rhodophyta-Palmaria_palmata.ctg25903.p1  ORF type:complete len:213 (-),score=14.43 Plantae.Rhodophyta-Palmaria_palmata.ctg25903:50-649(-)
MFTLSEATLCERYNASLQSLNDSQPRLSDEPTSFNSSRDEYGSSSSFRSSTSFHSVNSASAEQNQRQENDLHNNNANASTPMIEVFPGVNLRLRGVDEIQNAIATDFFTPHVCACCSSMIFCILDADFVLCPSCRVVGAMDANKNGSTTCNNDDLDEEDCCKAATANNERIKGGGGVGLGFTLEDLARGQADVKRQRSL